MKTDLYNLQQMNRFHHQNFQFCYKLTLFWSQDGAWKKHAYAAREQHFDQFLGFTIFLRYLVKNPSAIKVFWNFLSNIFEIHFLRLAQLQLQDFRFKISCFLIGSYSGILICSNSCSEGLPDSSVEELALVVSLVFAWVCCAWAAGTRK